MVTSESSFLPINIAVLVFVLMIHIPLFRSHMRERCSQCTLIRTESMPLLNHRCRRTVRLSRSIITQTVVGLVIVIQHFIVVALIIHIDVLILHPEEVFTVHHIVFLRDMTPSHITGIIQPDTHLVGIRGRGVLGSDNNNAVSTLRTVDCGSCSIFQDVHRLDVTRRDIRNTGNRETVHDIERLIALGQ